MYPQGSRLFRAASGWSPTEGTRWPTAVVWVRGTGGTPALCSGIPRVKTPKGRVTLSPERPTRFALTAPEAPGVPEVPDAIGRSRGMIWADKKGRSWNEANRWRIFPGSLRQALELPSFRAVVEPTVRSGRTSRRRDCGRWREGLGTAMSGRECDSSRQNSNDS